MGPQDGVDIALAAAHHIVHAKGRRDISFTLMGAGDCYSDLVAQRDRLGLQDFVEMPGRVPDEVVAQVLSTADVGLCPDPQNPLNDVSTMNKTMEYMAFGLPLVAFALTETKVSAQDAAWYVEANDAAAYAQAITELVDDPRARLTMGRRGRELVEQQLAWEHQQAGYLAVFDDLVGWQGAPPRAHLDGVQGMAVSPPAASQPVASRT
jgi:glycosyltransferase involved in cell wall biosynthesis